MGIYIKGIEMPKDCQYCPCCKWKHNGDGILGCLAKNNYFTEMELCHEGKPSWCPLTEILEPHGKLVNSDMLYASIAKDTYLLTDESDSRDYGMFLIDIRKKIDKTPIVIERSE